MTRSADLLRDLNPSEDKVEIGNGTLIGVERYGSLTVLSNKAGGIRVRLEKVTYVPGLAFNLVPTMPAHTRGGFATDDEDMSLYGWVS